MIDTRAPADVVAEVLAIKRLYRIEPTPAALVYVLRRARVGADGLPVPVRAEDAACAIGEITGSEWPCVKTAARRLRRAGFAVRAEYGIGLTLEAEPGVLGGNDARPRDVVFRSKRRRDAVRVLAGRVCDRCGAVRAVQ